ncbi:hypothetical protein L7F22_062861 [Adiantum nelumboides]|nr:hypothetical protein [Adiantum nelumboides]
MVLQSARTSTLQRLYADVKDGLGTDVNKSVAENSDVQLEVLSGSQGSPASSHVANPWSVRLHKEVSRASSINVSKKVKEKVYECMRMPNVRARHDDVDGHSSGFEHSLDEELGIPFVRTPGVRRLYGENKAPGRNAEPRTCGRNRFPIDRLTYDGYVEKHFAFMAKVTHDVEPICFEEAAANVKWQEAMNEKMDALYDNETWELVLLLKDVEPICFEKAAENVKLEDATMYRRIVGSLIYMTISRQDLSYTVGLVSQFMQLPVKPHLHAKRCILRYVRVTLDYAHFYDAGTKVKVYGCTDSDCAGGVSYRRSSSNYISFGSATVTWNSKRQSTVALSSTEAEYKGTTVAACEVAWLEMLLRDLEIQVHDPVVMYSDNLSSIQLARNTVFYARTKHIEVHYHFIKERILDGNIDLAYGRREATMLPKVF